MRKSEKKSAGGTKNHVKIIFVSLAQETLFLIIRIIVYSVSSFPFQKKKILINVGKVQEQANF